MEEDFNGLYGVTPIDGRYYETTKSLREYFSEYAYIKYRVLVEIKWLEKLISNKEIIDASFEEKIDEIENIYKNFNLEEAKKVKKIEKTTNHDVKAIEYYIREKLKEIGLENIEYLVHFGCTSEDINNLAIGKMIQEFLSNNYYSCQEKMINLLKEKKNTYKDIIMLSHTHGQVATPTTIGKEFAVYVYRLESILKLIKSINLRGKFSGAVGNFAAVSIAYPNLDWFEISKQFVEELGLEYNPLTTQIESHDMECVLFSLVKNFNNVLYDLSQDMWLYISKRYFKLKVISGEVGSSVMPHKVNPINFENAMANIKLSNSIIDCLVNTLEISRMQRDLSDSSMQRNIGVAFSYSIIAISQIIKGLDKSEPNINQLEKDLKNNPEVLAEAIQTVLRKNKDNMAYEKLKEFTRGKSVTMENLKEFISKLEINQQDKEILLNLNPESYIGYSKKLSDIV